MAAFVTLTELIARVRFEADMVSSTRASDTEITRLINTHWGELYDRLVASGPPDYYKSSVLMTTAAGTSAYALPGDFRSLLGVYVPYNGSATRLLPVSPMNHMNRECYDAPAGAYSVTLEYIPIPVLFTISIPTAAIDGVSGWDELVVQLCARALLRRDRRDVSSFSEAIAECRARVMSNAPKRDAAGPKLVGDIESASPSSLYATGRSVDAWSLQGGPSRSSRRLRLTPPQGRSGWPKCGPLMPTTRCSGTSPRRPSTTYQAGR